MKKSVQSLFVVGALAFATVAFAQSPKGSLLRLDKKVEIGATTLEPGVYMVKVLPGKHRSQLVVTNEDGSKTLTTLLAIPQTMMATNHGQEQVVYYPATDGSTRVVRTWYVTGANGGAYDIVYPSTRASELAVLGGQPVIAYRNDMTSSEWTTAELEMVDSDQKVTVYVDPAGSGKPMVADSVQAKADPAADRYSTTDRDNRTSNDEYTAGSSNRELPRTASHLPLFGALGALLLLAAFGLRFFRAA